MIIPTLTGFTPGEIVTAAKLTEHTKTPYETLVYNRPLCTISATTAISVPNGTSLAPLPMNQVQEDNDGMADLANNRIVIQTPGRYNLHAQIAYATNGTGARLGAIAVNGTIRAAVNMAAVSGQPTRGHIYRGMRLSAGDSVQLYAAQTSGGALNIDGGFSGCFLTAQWVAL